MLIDTTTRTSAITLDMIPIGPLWEEDGACWKADFDSGDPKGWRWFPLNTDAFVKDGPEGEMTDFPPSFTWGFADNESRSR